MVTFIPDEIEQIAHKAQALNLHKSLIIAPNTPTGRRLAKAFETSWVHDKNEILERVYYKDNNNLQASIKKNTTY